MNVVSIIKGFFNYSKLTFDCHTKPSNKYILYIIYVKNTYVLQLLLIQSKNWFSEWETEREKKEYNSHFFPYRLKNFRNKCSKKAAFFHMKYTVFNKKVVLWNSTLKDF